MESVGGERERKRAELSSPYWPEGLILKRSTHRTKLARSSCRRLILFQELRNPNLNVMVKRGQPLFAS